MPPSARRLSRRLSEASLVLFLVASACQSSTTKETTRPVEESATTVPSGGPAGTDKPTATLSTDEPPISGLEAAQPIVAPGESVTLTGSTHLSGQLRLTGPDGAETTAQFTGGSGTVKIPAGAAEGPWQAVVTSDSGSMAVGSVEVASGPSLLLVADRSHVAPAGDVTVTLHASGLPDDTQVMFGWGDLDWNAYFEDEETEGEEPLGVLIPDAHGLLQLGATPAFLGEVVGRPLAMGGGLEIAGLQAMAFSPTSDDVYLSDLLLLEGCAAPVPIQGTIGGPGAVHLLSFGDGLRSAAVVTSDGSFAVEAPHGPTTVFAARDDGQALDPVDVDIPCAGMVDIDLASGEVMIEAPGVGTVEEEEGFVAGESGTLTLSGDLSESFPVEPVCQYDGAGIEIIFGTYDLDLPAVQMTVTGGGESGSHQGTVEITDWSDVTQSTGAVEVGIEYAASSGLANAAMNIAGEYAGEAGAGSIEGTFSCVVLGLTPPVEVAAAQPDVDEVAEELLIELPPTVFDTPGPDPATVAPACRVIVVDDLGDPGAGIQTAVALRASLSRATVVTFSELHALFGPDRGDEPLGPGRSSSVSFTVEEGTPVILVENASDAESLAAQVACVDVGSVDVASGETAQLVVRATDLAGVPIAEAPVVVSDSEYGTVEPSEGMLRSGRFEADYTGGEAPGEESMSIELGGDGYPSGFAFANVATGFAYTMEGQYREVLAPEEDTAPVPPGPLGITLVAKSCTGRGGPWDGVLVLEAGPLLTMVAMTGLAGGVASSLFGTQVELQEGPKEFARYLPFPDIGLSLLVAEDMSANPAFITAPVALIMEQLGTGNPYQPIVLPVRFSLRPGGKSSAITEGSPHFAVRAHRARPNEVSLGIEGPHLIWDPNSDDPRKVTASHLLKAAVSRVPACPTDAELAQRVGELVPEPSR